MRQQILPRLNNFAKRVLLLLVAHFIWVSTYCQHNSAYSVLVAGHAYGAHAGKNIGLHPPLLKKMQEHPDPNVFALFLTGDIVNTSSTASWNQVEHELSELGLTSYYVMGNHDDNAIGHDVFKKKHGGLYYSFTYQNDLFVILNSTESDRSISTAQQKFLTDLLQNSDAVHKRVFIFFHEIIWNSHEKYKFVRSNSRSRYDQIKSVANFWEKVFPILTASPETQFYLIAGDVGGNPDAIAASYDRWENVTLVSSGMGEVSDENYLRLNVLPDTVEFTLIPLNEGVKMHPITWYNVPEKPTQIEGSKIVFPPESGIRYLVSPVFNATSYKWNFSNGISGISDSTDIDLRFADNFQIGQIMARAVNDGFGESDPVVFDVQSNSYTDIPENELGSQFCIHQNQRTIQFNCQSDKRLNAKLQLYNSCGMLLFQDEITLSEGLNTKNIDTELIGKGLILIELSLENKRLIKKMILY